MDTTLGHLFVRGKGENGNGSVKKSAQGRPRAKVPGHPSVSVRSVQSCRPLAGEPAKGEQLLHLQLSTDTNPAQELR